MVGDIRGQSNAGHCGPLRLLLGPRVLGFPSNIAPLGRRLLCAVKVSSTSARLNTDPTRDPEKTKGPAMSR
jgi:hypothetical protein